jgi:hypothetical protein
VKWHAFATLEWHRRAVVAARTTTQPDLPCPAPSDLWLQSARGSTRYDSHPRPDGVFFFLDVPAGRYVLNCIDADGVTLEMQKVVVPATDPDARLPRLQLVVPIAPPTSPGRRQSRSRAV